MEEKETVEKIVERNDKKFLVKYILGPHPKNFGAVLDRYNRVNNMRVNPSFCFLGGGLSSA